MVSAACSLCTMSPCVEARRARPLLGTFVEIQARAPNEQILRQAIERAFGAVVRVHVLMSFHEQNSDVSRLNRDAARRAVRVHHWTARVLRAAQRFARESQGAFDVTVAASLRRARLLPDFGMRRCEGRWSDIEITRDHHVRFARPLIIDFGGIAKGFAVDRAIDALRKAGAVSGIVNAGGDLRVFGDTAEMVRIRSAAYPAQVGAVLALRNRALATSAFYFGKEDLKRGVSSLVDGRDRAALLDEASVTVSADDCMSADALTKIALVLRDKARPILERHAADAFLLESGREVCWLSGSHAPQRHQA
jgi:thiamine biosynthesis lipoprotein